MDKSTAFDRLKQIAAGARKYKPKKGRRKAGRKYHYNPLTDAERGFAVDLRTSGLSFSQISDVLGREYYRIYNFFVDYDFNERRKNGPQN